MGVSSHTAENERCSAFVKGSTVSAWITPSQIVEVLGEGRNTVPLCLGFKFTLLKTLLCFSMPESRGSLNGKRDLSTFILRFMESEKGRKTVAQVCGNMANVVSGSYLKQPNYFKI